MIMKNSDNQKLIHNINLIMDRLNAIKTNIKIIDDYDEKLSIIINNYVRLKLLIWEVYWIQLLNMLNLNIIVRLIDND